MAQNMLETQKEISEWGRGPFWQQDPRWRNIKTVWATISMVKNTSEGNKWLKNWFPTDVTTKLSPYQSNTLQLLYQVMKYSSLYSTVCHQVCLTDGHSGSFSYHDNISLHSSASWLWKCTRRQRENVRRWEAATEHNKQSPLTGLLWLQIA